MTATCVIARTDFLGLEHEENKPDAATTSKDMTTSSFFTRRASLGQAVVFLKDGAEAVVGEGDDFVVFDAGHGFRGNHGVDDGFFGGLNRGGEDDFDSIIGQHFQIDEVVGSGGAGIRRRERDENVAGAVAGDAAVAPEPQRDAARQALELMRDERGIGGDDHDDRAALQFIE